MRVRPFDIYAKELSIIGSYAGTYDTWPRAIELLGGKRVDPSLIVDSVRSLDEAVDAIKGLATDKSTVKIHIQV
jgi:threonine dehydrogenase-like Zn-dependent dehydrogenase